MTYEITIPKLLKAAALCCDKRDDRHRLDRVHLEQKNGLLTIVSTSGHVMFHASVPRVGKDRTWDISPQRATNGSLCASEKREFQFPDWRAIVRQYVTLSAKQPQVAIQLRYIRLVSAVGMKLNNDKEYWPGVAIEKHGELDPIRFTYANNIWLIVMPVRMDGLNKSSRKGQVAE